MVWGSGGGPLKNQFPSLFVLSSDRDVPDFTSCKTGRAVWSPLFHRYAFSDEILHTFGVFWKGMIDRDGHLRAVRSLGLDFSIASLLFPSLGRGIQDS